MKNETFRKIVSTPTFTLPATNIHPASDRTFSTSNALLIPKMENYYLEYATGIKTGFTDPAGDCLVASAKKDGIEFICVCLHDGYLENGLREKFLDCKNLLKFAIDNYTSYYIGLQEELEKSSMQKNSNDFELFSFTNQDDQNSLLNISIKIIITIIGILIILIYIKLVFFRKKKKKLKRSKKH